MVTPSKVSSHINLVDTPKTNQYVDRCGAIASGLCVMHCILCTVFPMFLGALGLGELLGHESEWIFILISLSFAGSALIAGYKDNHSPIVLVTLTLGMLGLMGSRLIEMNEEHHTHHHIAVSSEVEHHENIEDEPQLAGVTLGIFSGLLLISGHLVNLRQSRLTCDDEC